MGRRQRLSNLESDEVTYTIPADEFGSLKNSVQSISFILLRTVVVDDFLERQLPFYNGIRRTSTASSAKYVDPSRECSFRTVPFVKLCQTAHRNIKNRDGFRPEQH